MGRIRADGGLTVSYDQERDVLTVEGVEYSGGLFRGIAIGDPKLWYRFDRSGGTVMVTTVAVEERPPVRAIWGMDLASQPDRTVVVRPPKGGGGG